MKFAISASALATLALAVSSTSAAPAPEFAQLSARQTPEPDCRGAAHGEGIYHNVFDTACVNLIETCRNDLTTANSTDVWSFKRCVAAATCQGTHWLIETLECETGDSIPLTGQNSLDYNIYAGIVGDCAWQEGGCPMTQQNYIDFIFGTLSEINTNTWPDVNNVINNWWSSIKTWTATGETVPYLNFNDWLRFSNSQ
ncbi:hypothetical protein D9758_006369 [Tetrapyrgos nigripes]|uniref:Uncharacterized protein n=1 Tax=Tetrapyrgos nigripes TaxID=182062 RepID=A0A8H5G097_9AGAR|nr:hypothetical protein D9758_006369 [Tetrapyrgos nigripes]